MLPKGGPRLRRPTWQCVSGCENSARYLKAQLLLSWGTHRLVFGLGHWISFSPRTALGGSCFNLNVQHDAPSLVEVLPRGWGLEISSHSRVCHSSAPRHKNLGGPSTINCYINRLGPDPLLLRQKSDRAGQLRKYISEGGLRALGRETRSCAAPTAPFVSLNQIATGAMLVFAGIPRWLVRLGKG